MNHKYLVVGLAGCLFFARGDDRVHLPQLAHGTILVFAVEPGRIVVAADSRLSIGSKPVSDQACKIISLSSDTLFFYGGIGEVRATAFTGNRVTPNEVARYTFGEIGKQPNSLKRLVDLAQRWAAYMKPITDFVLQNIPPAERPNQPSLGGFAGLDGDGHPLMVLANVDVIINSSTGQGASQFTIHQFLDDPRNPIGIAGAIPPSVVSEFLADTTERAKTAAREFQKRVTNKPMLDYEGYRYIAAVEAAMKWSPNEPTVGGRVDGLIFNYGQKIRWLQRKPACYKEDYNSATQN